MDWNYIADVCQSFTWVIEYPEYIQQAANYQGAPSTVSLALHDSHVLLALV